MTPFYRDARVASLGARASSATRRSRRKGPGSAGIWTRTAAPAEQMPQTIGRYQVAGEHRLRRDGGRLQGLRPAHQAHARHQDDPARHPAPEPAVQVLHRALLPRGAHLGHALASRTSSPSSTSARRAALPYLAMEFVEGETHRRAARAGHRASSPRRSSGWSARSPPPSTTRTARASSTATSSPRT